MLALNYDLGYLKAGVSEIEAYLLSQNLFWTVSGGAGSYPRLTLGGVLFAVQRVSFMDLSPPQKNELNKLETILNAARSRWQVAWGRKSQREFLSRLRQWQNYLNELIRDPEDQASYYSSEVRLRVFASLLLHEMEPPDPVHLDLLGELDTALRSIFVPGDFIWENQSPHAFPKESYWYLWGKPEAR